MNKFVLLVLTLFLATNSFSSEGLPLSFDNAQGENTVPMQQNVEFEPQRETTLQYTEFSRHNKSIARDDDSLDGLIDICNEKEYDRLFSCCNTFWFVPFFVSVLIFYHTCR